MMFSKVRVKVLTGAMKNAGTDANVYISFRNRNTRKWTAEQLLDSPKDDFECGQTDIFDVDFGFSAVDVDRIRIRHDNTGKKPGWFLSMVVLEDIETHREVTFPFNRWLAADEDDGISTEIGASSIS